MRAALVLLCLLSAPLAGAWQTESEVGLELLAFAREGAQSQTREDASLRLQTRLFHDWNDERDRISVQPFLRLDAQDAERTHADLREALWTHAGAAVEWRAGVGRVFWGVTEGTHLVDVVNQTDLVEDPDGEDKLGQPMVAVSMACGAHVLDAYLLAGFRERRYPGADGRFRLPWVVDDGLTRWESGRGASRVDGALRWLWNDGPWWLAVSGFSGTSRDPVLQAVVDPVRLKMTPSGPAFEPDDEPVLRAVYPLMEQWGTEVQYTRGDWLWKLEGIERHVSGEVYRAVNAGVEYTQVGVAGSAVDLGWLLEILHDSRGDDATTPFASDVLVGWRIAGNDAAASQALFYAIVDHDTREALWSLEASTRLRDWLTLSLQLRSVSRSRPAQSAVEFLRAPQGAASLQPLSRDDHARIELTAFF